jgi:carbamoyltransferase
MAHAWSAYAPAAFDSSLILVLDGDGDNHSGMVLVGEGRKMTRLRKYVLNQSLGQFYMEIIKILGYNRFDEYKVMGLAPYGNPATYAPLFEKCYRLLPDGDYALDSSIVWMIQFERAGLLDKARRKGEPFTQVHKDIAAALQLTLENIVLHILKHYKKATGQKNLSFAGGVAHNCTLNGKILYSRLFENVFVQPAAHDAGGALGAALGVLYSEQPASNPRKLEHVYYGSDIGGDPEVRSILDSWGDFISFQRLDNVAETTAQLLADGAVLGWVQGRSEFGPRALGNRSILADPRPAHNKLLINQMVKKREEYRPFAPSVLEESLSEFFDVAPHDTEFPFMIFVLRVREHVREQLGAITHVDGTARVHTVSRKTNRVYWDLINEFGKLTGVPILLNTSFNNNMEPIVDSVDEAVVCYLTTGLHYLVVGNFLVTKKDLDPASPAYLGLVPNLPRSRKLVRRKNLARNGLLETVFEVDSTVSRFFSQPVVKVSEDAFDVLGAADGSKPLLALYKEAGIADEPAPERLTGELLELWSRRVINLRPERPS